MVLHFVTKCGTERAGFSDAKYWRVGLMMISFADDVCLPDPVPGSSSALDFTSKNSRRSVRATGRFLRARERATAPKSRIALHAVRTTLHAGRLPLRWRRGTLHAGKVSL